MDADSALALGQEQTLQWEQDVSGRVQAGTELDLARSGWEPPGTPGADAAAAQNGQLAHSAADQLWAPPWLRAQANGAQAAAAVDHDRPRGRHSAPTQEGGDAGPADGRVESLPALPGPAPFPENPPAPLPLSVLPRQCCRPRCCRPRCCHPPDPQIPDRHIMGCDPRRHHHLPRTQHPRNCQHHNCRHRHPAVRRASRHRSHHCHHRCNHHSRRCLRQSCRTRQRSRKALLTGLRSPPSPCPSYPSQHHGSKAHRHRPRR